jgi:hypothetical protein
MKRRARNGNNSFARYGLKGHTVTTMYHVYRGGVRR